MKKIQFQVRIEKHSLKGTTSRNSWIQSFAKGNESRCWFPQVVIDDNIVKTNRRVSLGLNQWEGEKFVQSRKFPQTGFDNDRCCLVAYFKATYH